MKVLWIAGLPEEVRQAYHLTDVFCAAWSWVIGFLPPPDGIELHILCPVFRLIGGEQHFKYKGANWHCFPLQRWEPLFFRRRFAWSVGRFVRKFAPDIIHGWGGESGCGLVATYLTDRAVVSVQGLLKMLDECHDRSVPALFRLWLERMTYRRANCLVCESDTARRELMRLYNCSAHQIIYPLRNEFLIAQRRSESIDGRFLFIGQAVARKGFFDVQYAFKKVKAVRPKATLTIVSQGKSAAEIVEMMRSHDIFVLPSYGDTGPTVIKEALSQGMMCVAYRNSGPEELLSRYGGRLVETGDGDALARAMIEAIDNYSDCTKTDECACRIRNELNPTEAWRELRDVYGGIYFDTPPNDQMQGAIGQRVSHFRKMIDINPNVIISFRTSIFGNIKSALSAKLHKRKVVREINEWPLSVIWRKSKFKQWFEIHILPKMFDGAVCISDVLEGFWKRHGRRGCPVLKIPMTVDFDAVDQIPPNKDIPAQTVVYAGSMTEGKDGVETLRNSFKIIQAHFPEAQLRMVHNLPHDEAVSIMKSATCLALARPDSLQAQAGFPTKLGEYLATGRPVVVTSVGEIPYFLEDGVSAFLAEPGSVEDFATKIIEVLSDSARAECVGATGREVAKKFFDWRNYDGRMNEWLKQFI